MWRRLVWATACACAAAAPGALLPGEAVALSVTSTAGWEERGPEHRRARRAAAAEEAAAAEQAIQVVSDKWGAAPEDEQMEDWAELHHGETDDGPLQAGAEEDEDLRSARSQWKVDHNGHKVAPANARGHGKAQKVRHNGREGGAGPRGHNKKHHQASDKAQASKAAKEAAAKPAPKPPPHKGAGERTRRAAAAAHKPAPKPGKKAAEPTPAAAPAPAPSGGGGSKNAPGLSGAQSCLAKTVPSIKLEYPKDAMAHYKEIHHRLEKWTSGAKKAGPHEYLGYSGPRTENAWVDHFKPIADKAANLEDHFGPYVPIFCPWVDVWAHETNTHPGTKFLPSEFLQTIYDVLRPGVPYITVSHSDMGVLVSEQAWGSYTLHAKFPNVMVLSGGGYGHAAIPLFFKPQALAHVKPPTQRPYLVNYVGSLNHAPDGMRYQMDALLRQSVPTNQLFVGHPTNWTGVMADSKFTLTPRGFGRSAFHVAETWQMGLIPIYVYLDKDLPWVPYRSLFEKAGFTTRVSDIPALVKKLKAMPASEISAREALVRSLRDSHFTFDGAMDQVAKFMKNPGSSDIECQKLPKMMRWGGYGEEEE